MAGNILKFLEMEMAETGWNLLELAENGLNGRIRLLMVGYKWKCLEMARKASFS